MYDLNKNNNFAPVIRNIINIPINSADPLYKQLILSALSISFSYLRDHSNILHHYLNNLTEQINVDFDSQI